MDCDRRNFSNKKSPKHEIFRSQDFSWVEILLTQYEEIFRDEEPLRDEKFLRDEERELAKKKKKLYKQLGGKIL